MSSDLAAAICEADAPCSVNTALYSQSSLTLSSPEHDSPLGCSEMFRKLGAFEMAEVHDFPCQLVFQLVPFFVDCGLGIRNVRRTFYSEGLIHRTVVEVGHVSFFGDVVHVHHLLKTVPALLLMLTASPSI